MMTTRISKRRVLALALVAAAVLLWRPAGAHVRAASLLTRFADPYAGGLVADAARHTVTERSTTVPLPSSPASPAQDLRSPAWPAQDLRSPAWPAQDLRAPARLYLPSDVVDPPGVVIVHGVHFKGIDEPRLQAFARTIAATGVAVLTPEVRELTDYTIDAKSIATIGASAHALGTELGATRPIKVGIMGLSFAGGLSVIAASDPRFANDIAFVVAIGAHDDLGRVLRFFATNRIARPDGSIESLQAHNYGPVVLMYSHVEDFFPPADRDVARESLRLWLHEHFDDARAAATRLGADASRAKMQKVFEHDVAALAPELLAEIDRLEPSFASVSPSAHARDVHVPVFLLHGAGDTVIPATETVWLARDLPAGAVAGELISEAVQHVELHGEPGIGDKMALVHFLSRVLEQADAERE
jgi:dienelactone hydrolase